VQYTAKRPRQFPCQVLPGPLLASGGAISHYTPPVTLLVRNGLGIIASTSYGFRRQRGINLTPNPSLWYHRVARVGRQPRCLRAEAKAPALSRYAASSSRRSRRCPSLNSERFSAFWGFCACFSSLSTTADTGASSSKSLGLI